MVFVSEVGFGGNSIASVEAGKKGKAILVPGHGGP
jgi:hypothetical protein